MPLHYVLADLLARVPRAQAVVFLDDSGETVDIATTCHSAEELKVMGAYFEIGLRQARGLLEPAKLGGLESIYLRHATVNVHATCLSDGYYLILLQSFPSSIAIARRCMKSAVTDLERELF